MPGKVLAGAMAPMGTLLGTPIKGILSTSSAIQLGFYVFVKGCHHTSHEGQSKIPDLLIQAQVTKKG